MLAHIQGCDEYIYKANTDMMPQGQSLEATYQTKRTNLKLIKVPLLLPPVPYKMDFTFL